MIPSVLTSQIRRGVEDFLQTTFPPSNRFFHGLLDRLIAKEGTQALVCAPAPARVVNNSTWPAAGAGVAPPTAPDPDRLLRQLGIQRDFTACKKAVAINVENAVRGSHVASRI